MPPPAPPDPEEDPPSATAPGSTGSNPNGDGAASKLQDRPQPGLYIVATPIGNARDITLRALDVLAGVDLIACEDTRVTRPFLRRYGIATPLVSYHDHNADRVRPGLLDRLGHGAALALVSDSGMPLISDPGYKLVRAAIDAALPVTCLPGPSAPATALALAGLPTDRFFMGGFLPAKAAARRARIAEAAAVPATLVFLESAGRLADTLAALGDGLGDRPAAVARELTKRFEEVRRGSLAALARHYTTAGPPKGEIVIVVGPPAAPAADDDDAIDAALDAALADGASRRDAVARVAAASGLPRRRVYRRALALSGAAAAGAASDGNEPEGSDSIGPAGSDGSEPEEADG